MYQQIFEQHAQLLKALAHPRRLEIIGLLRDRAINVSQIQKMLGLPQANLSQHLGILKEAGVVEFTKEGKEVTYRLADRRFIGASDLMREILIERSKGDPGMANELSFKMRDLLPVVKDPVCGMRVSPKTAGGAVKYKDRVFYFCAAGCEKKFKLNPGKFSD